MTTETINLPHREARDDEHGPCPCCGTTMGRLVDPSQAAEDATAPKWAPELFTTIHLVAHSEARVRAMDVRGASLDKLSRIIADALDAAGYMIGGSSPYGREIEPPDSPS